MKVTVDIKDVQKLTREAHKKLDRVGDVMKAELDAAAALERATHEYNNYTHRLENSTFALGPLKSADGVSVEYGARMEYASFVENRGRTRVREIGLRAGDRIRILFEGDADELGEM